MALVMMLAGPPGSMPDAAAGGANPVVLVHGLNSTATKWAAYLGPEGFLAKVGRRGFAVGDGQTPGVLRTGSYTEPFGGTNTIAENAAILRDYIAGVRRMTGAARVDIVAHSMGGLISRYYIDRLMDERDVDRLVMLGTPNGGSPCANLPARLGISTPATLELRPSYLNDVFNQQITRRNGVSFHALAGDVFTEALRSPCTGAPSDLVVDVDSVEAAGVAAKRLPLLHDDLQRSAEAFGEFVAPALASDVAEPGNETGTSPARPDEPQTVALAAGHVAAGAHVEQVLNIDEVAVATFAIFDSTRSLAVSVRGASGNPLELSAAENGLIKIDDPETLLYLGYGFVNPQPGPWWITLHSTDRTPPTGADFALTAQVQGGATLRSQTSELLPEVGEEVHISATFESDGPPVAIRRAVALIRTPDGGEEAVMLKGGGVEPVGAWRPDRVGLHGIDVVVVGETADGERVERTDFLVAEVQAVEAGIPWFPIFVLAGVALIVVAGVGGFAALVVAVYGFRRRSSRVNA
ncbi:alpha/beta fold hydrolase [Micromonospora sp. WMMD1082]|uniref:alpha/beta fold hydrolase n=1 Tax=Micromonospora sp. WMMD1082 TaxID=3016104 RepID=UPI002416401D|nr:alpha/beta fold hydrolase [Micromonospora sp. WMMD1082]MDG4795719.1 alpha/beta fold hydrolase [Micromonospora sp. WMMD1082]